MTNEKPRQLFILLLNRVDQITVHLLHIKKDFSPVFKVVPLFPKPQEDGRLK